VDPIWRDIERDAHRLFNPPVEAVVPDSNAKLVVKQLLRPVTPDPAQNASAWLASNNTALRVQDSITALQKAYNRPAVGRTAVIEVDVDAEGQVTAIRLVQSAGTRRVDDEALRAVERALRLRPIRDPRGAVTARYALRAEVAVHIPFPTPGVESNNGAVTSVTAGISGTFDEVTRKVSPDKPFKKRVETRVDLISVRPRREAPLPAAPSEPTPAAP
jgi:TonB family protein